MPISLDEGFAGSLGVEFGAGAQMADQLDGLGRALERRQDPLTRIGLDTFDAIRAMASSLTAPPVFVTPVRIVNLGFLELMAGGTFAFAILIYLKLDAIWRRLGLTNMRLSQVINLLALNVAYAGLIASAVISLIPSYLSVIALYTGLIASAVVNLIPSYLSLIAQILVAMLAALGSFMSALAHIVIEHIYDIGPNLTSVDLSEMNEQLDELVGLLARIMLLGGPAGAALGAFGTGALAAAAGVGALALALQAMPSNVADLTKWIGILIGALAAVLVVFGLVLSRGKALVGVAVGVLGSLALLFGIAGALRLMPDNTEDLVKSLLKLGAGLLLLTYFLKGLNGGELKSLGLGLLALSAFLLLTAAAFRIFDDTAIQAMEKIPALFDALNTLAKNIVAQASNFETIAKGLAGIILFIGFLGLALRLFPDDAAGALEAMSLVFTQLTSIADKIVELADSGKLETVAAGLLGIIIFIGMLGVVLMLFDEQSIMAALAVAAVAHAFASLATALASIDPANFWIIVGLLAAMAVQALAIGVAAMIGGPHLSGLAEVLRAMSELLKTVASNAGKLADALRSLPSIRLPSLPSLPSFSLPSFDTGGPVHATGPYMLHQGEYVLNPQQTRAMAQAGQSVSSITNAAPLAQAGQTMADNSVSVGAVHVNVSAQSVDEASVPALGDEIVRQLASRLSELHRDDAFAQGVRAQAS